MVLLAFDAMGIEGVAPFLVAMAALALAVLPRFALRRLAPIKAPGGADVRSPVVAVGAVLAGFTEALIVSLLTVCGLQGAGTLRLSTTCIVGGLIEQWAVGLAIVAAALVSSGLVLALHGLSLTIRSERFLHAMLAGAAAAFIILNRLGAVLRAARRTWPARFVHRHALPRQARDLSGGADRKWSPE